MMHNILIIMPMTLVCLFTFTDEDAVVSDGNEVFSSHWLLLMTQRTQLFICSLCSPGVGG